MNQICCILLISFAFVITSIEGACQSVKSLNDPESVNCPQCNFVPNDTLLSGSGNYYTITCPPGHSFWWYQHSNQFTADTSKVGTKYNLLCDGSSWKLTIPGQSTVHNLAITAFACGDKR